MCGVDWQSLQNLCDLHGLELRENKYNGLGVDEGYTAILRNGQVSHSAHVPYGWPLADCIAWIEVFVEKHRGD